MPRVYVIVLNWNGWRDTLECLDSLLALDYEDYVVVVCDNASTDDSLERIRQWAQARGHAASPGLAELDRAAAEAGGDRTHDSRLVLIRTGHNLGFAGGMNVGLRYALARADLDYAWLLNNDTVVSRDALRHMVARMQEDPDAGLCGSTLVFHFDRDRVQALGGASFNRWRGQAREIGNQTPTSRAIDRAQVEARLAYVSGASMLASRRFLREVGLMSEHYFLYFEEIDWAERAKGKLKLVYAPDSLVFHKEGASIGTDSRGSRSSLSQYLLCRNRLLFMRKFHARFLFTTYLSLAAEALWALLRGRRQAARIMLGTLFGARPTDLSATKLS